MRFGKQILITFWKFWRNVGNLEKIFEEFGTDYVEVFWTFLWNFIKISKNCWKNYGVKYWINFGKIRGNIGVILCYWFCGNYKDILKRFLWNFSETVKKIWRTWGILCTHFLILWWEILWHFFVNFWKYLWKIIGKIWKILYGLCFFQECSYQSVHLDCAKYFPTSDQLMFQFL